MSYDMPDWLPEWAEAEYQELVRQMRRKNQDWDPIDESFVGILACTQAKWRQDPAAVDPELVQAMMDMRADCGLPPLISR